MADRGFAALPVVDGGGAVIGIVAEADVLRNRLPEDPRLHVRRDAGDGRVPPLLVGELMTTAVRTVLPTTDVAELAHFFLDEGLRSVPVLDHERLVGIVSRRDVLRALSRADDEIGGDVRRLVDSYTGGTDDWSVTVTEGVVDLRLPSDEDAAADIDTVRTLARTVPGVVAVRVHSGARPPG
jgi:CBS domain-containing protein